LYTQLSINILQLWLVFPWLHLVLLLERLKVIIE